MRTHAASDERTETFSASGEASAGSLRIMAFWPDGQATRRIAPGATIVVGRGDDCDLKVDHPSVSRRHFAVRAGPPAVIEDLASSNGTSVGGSRVSPHAPAPIAWGQLVEAGAARIVVHPGASLFTPVATLRDAASAARAGDTDRLLELVARSSLSVLLVGETGVGKEVAAERIHRLSPRAAAPMVTVNCAALPDAMVESELFGHEKGAFTGALTSKPGLFETADGGTLFLDEIGELSLGAQAKLLRALERGETTRLGGVRPRAADVRFIAATNRDLDGMIAQGLFREDLFFRLDGMVVRLPPLRERAWEIVPLASRFLEQGAQRAGVAVPRLSDDALACLVGYAWPGNIRELKNVVERAVVLCAGAAVVHPEHVVLGRASVPPSSPGAMPADLRADLEAVERRRVVEALEEAEGNQSVAAEILGISRRSLLRRLDQYALPRPRKVSARP